MENQNTLRSVGFLLLGVLIASITFILLIMLGKQSINRQDVNVVIPEASESMEASPSVE
jgi:hypothetical protein